MTDFKTVHEPIRHVERAIADPPRPSGRRGRPGSTFADGLMGISLLAGPANVIMQLARPGVGYGVLESRVESGRVDRHPIKRARTTFTYLAVAIAGSDAQKAAFRRAVNGAHAQVYSTPESPVQYNAFDPDLQLWVAACMYKGGVDVHRIFVGEIGRRGRRAPLSRGQGAGHHLAGAAGDVAGGPGCVRPLLAASRWPRCTSTTPSATTCIRSPCRVCAGWRCPRPLRRLPESYRLADHHRLSAATVSRRDAVAVGHRQAAALRPADGGAGAR